MNSSFDRLPVIWNGVLRNRESMHIDLSDRSFRYGDGAFETIRCRRGHPYLLTEHLQRLTTTLATLKLRLDMTLLEASCRELARISDMEDMMLRVTVSRGSGGQGYLPSPHSDAFYVIEALPLLIKEEEISGLTLMLSQWRKIPPVCLPTQGKHAQGINATLARLEARDAGGHEALQLSVEGFISSASSANIFWRCGESIFTPSLSTGCLAGVMRQRFIACHEGLVAEVEQPLEALLSADAVLLTNSRYLAAPVVAITGHQMLAMQSVEWALHWRERFESEIG